MSFLRHLQKYFGDFDKGIIEAHVFMFHAHRSQPGNRARVWKNSDSHIKICK